LLLINFSHEITALQQEQIERLVGEPIGRSIALASQFDEQGDFVEQARALLANPLLAAVRWQSEPLLIVLPSLNFIAAVLVAELHGRMGYFPTIVRVRPVAGATPRRYEVAELIDLQTVRDAARTTRGRGAQPDQGG
jgi:hypothetical protein